MAQTIKNPPTMQETQVQSLGREDPLEKEMASHSSNLARKNPVDRGAWQTIFHGVTKSRTRLILRVALMVKSSVIFLLTNNDIMI